MSLLLISSRARFRDMAALLRPGFLSFCLLSLLLLLSGCGDLPRPFRPLDKLQAEGTQEGLLEVPGAGGVVIMPVAGIGQISDGEAFAHALAEALLDREIVAGTDGGNANSLFISGRVTFSPALGPDIALSSEDQDDLSREEEDGAEEETEESAAEDEGEGEGSPGSSESTEPLPVPSFDLGAQAGMVVTGRQGGTSPTPTPTSAGGPSVPALPLSRPEIATPRDIVIGWEVVDAKGESVAAWRQTGRIAPGDLARPDRPDFSNLVQSSAASLADLMRRSGALGDLAGTGNKDPARAHRIAVLPGQSAPGDGNTALPMAMKRALARQRIPMAQEEKDAFYLLDCVVSLEKAGEGVRHMTIVWRLRGQDKAEIGKIEQANNIPDKLIRKKWGQLADVIAGSALPGMMKLLETQDGQYSQQHDGLSLPPDLSAPAGTDPEEAAPEKAAPEKAAPEKADERQAAEGSQ